MRRLSFGQPTFEWEHPLAGRAVRGGQLQTGSRSWLVPATRHGLPGYVTNSSGSWSWRQSPAVTSESSSLVSSPSSSAEDLAARCSRWPPSSLGRSAHQTGHLHDGSGFRRRHATIHTQGRTTRLGAFASSVATKLLSNSR